MTFWQWLGLASYVAFFVWCLAQVLGVRRRANRAATAAHLVLNEQPHITRWARAWQALDAWRTRPRARLTARDWNPRLGFVAQPTFIGGCLFLGAARGLADPKARLVSLPLFVAGAALLTLVVLFVLRPVAVPGGKFELRSVGYDPAEVDTYMATINARTQADIETVRFHLARPGYEFAAVDDKLDRLSGGATRTDGRHRVEGKHTYHARRP